MLRTLEGLTCGYRALFAVVKLSGMGDVRGKVIEALANRRKQLFEIIDLLGLLLCSFLEHG